MSSHRCAAAAAMIGALLAVSAVRPAPAVSASAVTLSRASGPTPFASSPCEHDSDKEFEPSVAIDPANPRHLVAAWIQDGALGVVAAATEDGGASWRRTVLPDEVQCTTSFDSVYDPRIAIGPDGLVYVVTLPVGVRGTGSWSIYVHRSLDGGMTWQPPATVSNGIPFAPPGDFPSIAAVPDRPGSAVVVWRAPVIEATMTSRTDDGGRTWSAPRVVRVSDPGSATLARVAALSADRLAIVYVQVFSPYTCCTPAPDALGSIGPVMTIHSTDGGATWSAPVQVSASANRDWFPDVTATPSGDLYAVAADADVDGASRVYVSRSSDGGATWTAPRQAAVQHPLHWTLPLPAIGASDGHVLVLFDDADGSTARARVVRSDDDGATWTEVFASEPFPVTMGSNTTGDYQQIAASDEAFAGVMVLGGSYAIDGPTDVWLAHGSL